MNPPGRLAGAALGVALALAMGAPGARAAAPGAAAQVLDVFPASAFEKPGGGDGAISSAYTASGSQWAQGVDEREVSQVELKHTQGRDNSFALRAGKGGRSIPCAVRSAKACRRRGEHPAT